MITATVTIKTASSCQVYDAIGFTSAAIQASYEDMFCDDEKVVVVDVMVH